MTTLTNKMKKENKVEIPKITKKYIFTIAEDFENGVILRIVFNHEVLTISQLKKLTDFLTSIK